MKKQCITSKYALLLMVTVILALSSSMVHALMLEQLVAHGLLDKTFSNKKIGYYLGSFDPLHKGHEEVARSCIEQKCCDFVIVYAAWGKDSYKNRAAVHIRQEMLDKTFGEDPNIIVTHLSPIEFQALLTREDPTRTIKHKPCVKPAFSGCEFIGIIGSDSAFYPDKSAYSYFMRGIKISEKHAQDTLGGILALPVHSFILAKRANDDITVLNHKIIDRPIVSVLESKDYQALSSTQLKQKLQHGESIEAWVNPEVLQIMKKYHLYVFGHRADTIDYDPNTIPEPKLSKTKKAYVTLNGFGFDVLHTELNWVVESFLDTIKPGMMVLDAGSGYGALSRQALKRGATVVSNEIAFEQLLYNLKHLTPLEKQHFYLSTHDLRTANYPEGSMDLIMFHRVFHFFKGEEIESILRKSRHWLKPQGKIYLVMMSKDHVAFRDKIKYSADKKWPGEDLIIVEHHLPDQAYALPKTLHVASIETLKHNIEALGYTVEKADYVSLKKLGSETHRDGREAIGIIARKN